MTNDNKRLVAEARDWAEWNRKISLGHNQNQRRLLNALADALEAATARTDREPQPGDGPDYHAEHASWLNRNRAVVEAQALEQAARDMYGQAVVLGGVPGWLRARAVEIREGQQ